jgi:hypothetical protein
MDWEIVTSAIAVIVLLIVGIAVLAMLIADVRAEGRRHQEEGRGQRRPDLPDLRMPDA